MDDPEFWRDAAQRFLACDPRSKIDMLWGDGVIVGVVEWTYTGAFQKDFDALDAIVIECGTRLDQGSEDPRTTWLSKLVIALSRYKLHRVSEWTSTFDRGKPAEGSAQRVVELCSAFASVLESEAIDKPLYSAALFAEPPPDRTWAVFPRVDDLDLRQPQFFRTRDEALVFQSLRVNHTEGFQGGPISWKDRGWHWAVPIRGVSYGAENANTFETFYPLSQVPIVMPGHSIDECVDRAFDGTLIEPECFLGSDWRFAEIEKDVRMRPGHQFLTRQHNSISQLVVKSIYDFDSAVRRIHPGLSADALADFFISWQLWRHVAQFCAEVGDSSIALQLSGQIGGPRDRTSETKDRLYEVFGSYAHHLRPSIMTPEILATAAPIVAITTKDRVENFLNAVLEVTGKAVNKSDFWMVAGYQERSEFERFQRDDPRTTDKGRQRFESVLTLNPHRFLERLTLARK